MFCLALSFDVKLMGEAQTEAAAAKRGRAASAISNAAARCVVVPAAATAHAVIAGGRTRRISLRRREIRVIPVRAPFPNVAAHVVQAQLVRRLAANGVDLTV